MKQTKSILYSQSEVLLREIVQGKEIESEDIKLLQRLIDSFDDLPTNVLFRLKSNLSDVRVSLEKYTRHNLSTWELVYDDPRAFESELESINKFGSSYLYSTFSTDLVYSVGKYAIRTQLEMLSLFPVFQLTKKYVDYLNARISELESQIEKKEKEPQAPVFPLKKFDETEEEDPLEEEEFEEEEDEK